jgi:hypothetical protein
MLAIVEHERDEPADETHAMTVEHGGQRIGIAREETWRAQLRGTDAEGSHFRQHPVGGEHRPPSGHLADAP